MYNFKFHKVDKIEDAVAILSSAEDPKILSGGHTLIPTLKQRLSQPTDVIDISNIDGLKSIKNNGDAITIGALCTHNQVAASIDVQSEIVGLASMASQIGDPQVRHRGTIGGSIANADPAADYPAAVLALDAQINTSSNSYNSDDFFIDMFETAINSDEIITSIDFKIPKKSVYKKFRNPASGYAMAGVFIAIYEKGIRVAITGAATTAFRLHDLEKKLENNFSVDVLNDFNADTTNYNSDIHASAKYRGNLVKVLLEEAIAQLV
jgi:carbon-monoxide dehydrogenase medium subunit